MIIYSYANVTIDQSGVVTIDGDLKIICNEKIGSGLFGCVFKGEIQGKQCAVKVLKFGMELTSNLSITPGGGTIQEAKLDSLEKECKYLLNLKHPNIVELTDIRYPRYNSLCLVMKLLDCSLRCYLKLQCLPLLHQISISCDIANGLAYLHENNLIHRHLCGDNILLKKGKFIPVAKIGDFGMSRIIDTQALTNSLTELGHSTTIHGHRKGYLPPEGLSSYFNINLDVFMFGVIMIQIAHGVQDITTPEEQNELRDKIANDHPLKIFIDSCVAESRSERPTADSVCKELQILLERSEVSPQIRQFPDISFNVGGLMHEYYL